MPLRNGAGGEADTDPSCCLADYGEDGDDEGSDDENEELSFDDVESAFFDDAQGKWNLKNVASTKGFVKRRYAFGIKGVPRKETNWLEVTCDFPGASEQRRHAVAGVIADLFASARPVGKRNEVDIPIDASGEMYTRVFGSTATPFERFVVDRKIMGPCWLNIKSPKINKGDAVSLGYASRSSAEEAPADSCFTRAVLVDETRSRGLARECLAVREHRRHRSEGHSAIDHPQFE
jgi:hypothetical protein